MSAHTPTPWTVSPGLATIWAKDGERQICDCDKGSLREASEDLANAAFIVRACNAHEQLVAALERTLNQLDSLASCTTTDQTGLIDPRKSPAYAQARQALAAAKGQP